MAAASYYNANQHDSNLHSGEHTAYSNNPHSIPAVNTAPQSHQHTAYSNNPHSIPAVNTAPQSHHYIDPSYHGVEPPSQPIEPLLNKPPPHHGASTSQIATQSLNVVDPSTSRLRQRRFQKWKRVLRIGQLLTKSLSILFSAIMFGIMVFIAIKYQSTKDDIRGGRNAWPKNPKLWPTFMLLVASGVTVTLSFFTLVLYCCNFNKARGSWKITILKYVIHIGAWVCVSIIYRYEKSLHGVNNDLWGWTCSEEVAALQSEFTGVVNFSSLCNSQSTSWYVSLAEFLAKIGFAIGHFIIYRKTREDEKNHLARGLGGAITDGIENIL